jgi:hypothetical protein
VGTSEFQFSIHNHFDRCIFTPSNAGAIPQVFLVSKESTPGAQPTPPGAVRDVLQSVAVFTELFEYAESKQAFARADQMSMFRGMRRLAVLNSYVAVESLANGIFKKREVERLVATGMPGQDAEIAAEQERKSNRTSAEFLLHKGMHAACGRSLCNENKILYDQILALRDQRHVIAHAGRKPDSNYTKEAHRTACEAVRWLADVGSLTIKPMLPDPPSTILAFSTFAKDNHVCSPAEMEVIRRLFDIIHPVRPSDRI